jgi:hypothetical protein
MNHPKREEWVPYLYGEAKPDVRRNLNAHLQDCAECRNEIQSWKHSLGQLDAWKLPSRRKANELFAPFLRLAAAAVIILSLGFAAGRVFGMRATTEKLRAAIEPEIRSQLKEEMARLVRDEIDRSSAAILSAANEQSDKTARGYAQALWFSLKKDVDTVAVNVDAGLRDTTQQLARLIDYKQPDGSPEIPRE